MAAKKTAAKKSATKAELPHPPRAVVARKATTAKKATAKRMGRPARAGEASTVGVTVRFTASEFAFVRAAAARAGVSPTEWVRGLALSANEKD